MDIGKISAEGISFTIPKELYQLFEEEPRIVFKPGTIGIVLPEKIRPELIKTAISNGFAVVLAPKEGTSFTIPKELSQIFEEEPRIVTGPVTTGIVLSPISREDIKKRMEAQLEKAIAEMNKSPKWHENFTAILVPEKPLPDWLQL